MIPWGYLARRILSLVPVVVVVISIVFFAMRFAPGDPAEAMLGLYASPSAVADLRKELGLDRPLVVQYMRFWNGLVRGNLGESFRTSLPVTGELTRAFSPTLLLASSSMALGLCAGLPAGVLSALRPNTWLDHLVRFLSVVGVSLPVFWLGLLLMMLFSLKLGWLPPAGYGSWQFLIMPAVALAANLLAYVARLTRTEMLETLRQEFVRTARAKGLNEHRVIYRHTLRNAALPTVTAVGLRFGALLGGAVLVESVFAWPGLGTLLVTAISARDYPIVQGGVILIAVVFILLNLFVDLLYAFLDPRIRYT
jgi:peptide/nickel transport system permease protein/oligopeptide transport system permease protein